MIVDRQLVIRSRRPLGRLLGRLWLLPGVVELAEGSVPTHLGRQARKLVHGGGDHFALLDRARNGRRLEVRLYVEVAAVRIVGSKVEKIDLCLLLTVVNSAGNLPPAGHFHDFKLQHNYAPPIARLGWGHDDSPA